MKGARSLCDSEIESVKCVLTNLRDYTLFIFLLKTGFRIREALSLTVSDVYQFNRMNSHVTVTRRNMKGSHESRTIVLHPEASSSVLKLITEYNLSPNDYLFQSRKGLNNPISTRQAWYILKIAFKAAQLSGKVSCHSTRKSFASKVFEASNRNLVVTQKALGHRNVSSTISYLDCESEIVDNLILGIK